MLFPWKYSTGFCVSSSSSSSSSNDPLSWRCTKTSSKLKVPYCSLRIQDIEVEYRELQPQLKAENDKLATTTGEFRTTNEDLEPAVPREASVGEGGNGMSGIQVPRQRFIATSKSELVDAIVLMFESQEEIDQFLLLSSCLESILHAEHRRILEEMRFDYTLTHSVEKKGTFHNRSADSEIENRVGMGSREEYREDKVEPDMPMSSNFSLDLRNLLGSSPKNVKQNSLKESRIAVATRFQRAFVQLLYNAQFEELSVRDLVLTSALNSDYLLTLPIYVDWKRASASNAIIFRRGYATERQRGLLIVEKLDYLQSKLLQEIFLIISKPLGKVGLWISEAFKSASQGQDAQIWLERAKLWLKELPPFQQSYSFSEQTSDNLLVVDQLNELPIWLAAQRAVTRYEGILSSVGPRGRLLRKLLMWIGLIPPSPKEPFELDSEVTASEPYSRPILLSRITLSDIWEPATRKCCKNDYWKMLKIAISIIFSQSILQHRYENGLQLKDLCFQQEPAFQELILLFTEEKDEGEADDTDEVPSLKLKIYERIPIPDLAVIFPHKKLSFRILDAVRLDVTTVLGLLAFFINYKFVDILSSPSAIPLDVIAISALLIYVSRVALGYRQTRDRYQLLVNKTLYEKTLASGFGSVHFLLDASEQQQYKEAILAYAILLKADTSQATCPQIVKNKCERFMYNMFKEQIEMPVDKAMDTLVRLGLVTEKIVDRKIRLQAIPCPKACDVLKQRWNSLLS